MQPLNPLAIPRPGPKTKLGNYRHGLSKSRIWVIYIGIKQRCSDKAGKNSKWYKNINCQWDTFEEFYKDMGVSYVEHVKEFGEEQTTIERMDSKGDYHKDNCRWATKGEQVRNSSQTRMFTHEGRTQCMKDWAREMGIKYGTLRYRIENGWRFEEAIIWNR